MAVGADVGRGVIVGVFDGSGVAVTVLTISRPVGDSASSFGIAVVGLATV